jgi:hypothetical protein
MVNGVVAPAHEFDASPNRKPFCIFQIFLRQNAISQEWSGVPAISTGEEIFGEDVVKKNFLVTLAIMKLRQKPTHPVVTAREAWKMIAEPSCYLVCVRDDENPRLPEDWVRLTAPALEDAILYINPSREAAAQRWLLAN